MGYGQGGYGLGTYGVDGAGGGPTPTITIYVFEPPTHEEPIRSQTEPLIHYRLTYANSIVKVNDAFVSVRTPAFDVVQSLTEGVDWFRGGYVYRVSPDTRDALIAAGYDVRTVSLGQEEQIPPPTPDGYGEGGYGEGNYGA